MIKICCDLCEKDMTNDSNKTKVTLEDNNGYDIDYCGVFRKPRKIKIDICDECLELLKSKAKS